MHYTQGILAMASLASGATVQMTYDYNYDNPSTPLNTVSCSNGPNGLETKYGWSSLGQVSGFPNIGGAFSTGYNSPNCGQCYKLTYKPQTGPAKSVNFVAVDNAGSGFNVGTSVFKKLVGSLNKGNVQVSYMKQLASACGLPPTGSGVGSSGTGTLTFDNYYNIASNSLNNVACSDGSNGVENRRNPPFMTIGDLPNRPNIGGAFAIGGYNSPNCGSCFTITYKPASGPAKSINVLAIDTAPNGFNIATDAFVNLVGSTAPGTVQVSYQQVNPGVCGFP